MKTKEESRTRAEFGKMFIRDRDCRRMTFGLVEITRAVNGVTDYLKLDVRKDANESWSKEDVYNLLRRAEQLVDFQLRMLIQQQAWSNYDSQSYQSDRQNMFAIAGKIVDAAKIIKKETGLDADIEDICNEVDNYGDDLNSDDVKRMADSGLYQVQNDKVMLSDSPSTSDTDKCESGSKPPQQEG